MCFWIFDYLFYTLLWMVPTYQSINVLNNKHQFFFPYNSLHIPQKKFGSYFWMRLAGCPYNWAGHALVLRVTFVVFSRLIVTIAQKSKKFLRHSNLQLNLVCNYVSLIRNINSRVHIIWYYTLLKLSLKVTLFICAVYYIIILVIQGANFPQAYKREIC